MSTDAGTPTPRTDVAHFQYGLSRDFMEFVKDLERELTALRTVHEAAQATIELLQKENGMQHTKLVAAQSKLATLLEAHNNLRADYQKARSECDGLRNPLVDANRCVHEMRDENKLHGHITDASAKWAYYIEPKIDAARKS